ncbi:hypothetical protein SAMN05443668_112129 [Cryptosporangium aurantiacum]|uniref:Uncharacterized protein n=1 Tax=Cryptosporangium aurantiacum TaxID=134849 RepID=A0A1M7RH63_9ACTN|nr:hypothetical protein SAMN05443668_112129 [Cryptosporangium aurantiacum]
MAGLVARQPLVLVVGPPGAGRSAALTLLAGPAAGGTMIDLGALWMAVDPPGDRPRTVRLNGAPSAVGRKGWEAIAGAIGAVAMPPSVVLVDTFRGLSAALGDDDAAQTVGALVAPGRTVVLVLDDLAEAERFGEVALRFGAVVSVDGQTIRGVHPVADLLGSTAPDVPPQRRAWAEAAAELAKPVPPVVATASVPAPEPREPEDTSVSGARRRRWWRRTEPTPESLGSPPVGPPPVPSIDPVHPDGARRQASPFDADGQPAAVPPAVVTPSAVPPAADVVADPAVGVTVAVTDTTGTRIDRPLAPGGYYLIQVAMRAASTGAPPDGPTAGTIGAWVQVSVVAETATVPAGPHTMFVPRHGAAWTCPCQPGGPHTCLPEERSERLELPFVAPRRPDVYRVHLAVRHRATVIHQTRLELPVAGPGLPASTGPSATVTYEAPRA